MTAAVPPTVTKPLDKHTFQYGTFQRVEEGRRWKMHKPRVVDTHVHKDSSLTWKSVHVDALSWEADAHVPVWQTGDTLTGQQGTREDKVLLEQHHSEGFCSSQHEEFNCVLDLNVFSRVYEINNGHINK